MKQGFSSLTALVLCSLLLTAGCGDKHEPTKPTVTSTVGRTLLQLF